MTIRRGAGGGGRGVKVISGPAEGVGDDEREFEREWEKTEVNLLP